MIPTVEEAIAETQFLLADTAKRVYTDAAVLPAVKRAIRTLKAEMAANQIPRMKVVATCTLPGNTSSLAPATVGIADFGELIELEERGSSSERYTHVTEVEKLPQRDSDTALQVFEWRGDSFWFIPATGTRELRLTYLDSGDAPTTGSIGIDGCLPYISAKAGAIVAPTKGDEDRGLKLEAEAAVELDKLLAPMIRKMQQTPVQPQPYRVRRDPVYPFSQPHIAAPLPRSNMFLLTISGTQDGENATFTLNLDPQGGLMLYRNGALLRENTGYTKSSTTITFLVPHIPQADDVLQAYGFGANS